MSFRALSFTILEPIDLTKTTFATQFTPKPSQSHRFCPELWKHTNEETLNEEIVNAVLRDIDSEGKSSVEI